METVKWGSFLISRKSIEKNGTELTGVGQILEPHFKTGGHAPGRPGGKLNSSVRGKAYIMQEAWFCLGEMRASGFTCYRQDRRFTPSVSNCGVPRRESQDVQTETPYWLLFQESGMRGVTALFLIRCAAHHE